MATTRILALALAVPLAAQGARVDDWAIVRTIPVGTRVSIRLLDGERQRAPRNLKGTLESAEEDSVVLRTRDAVLESVPRASIRKLKVYQPVGKRAVAWVTAGGVTTFMLAGFPRLTPGSADPWDREHLPIFLTIAAAVAVPVLLITLRATRYRTVYRED